MFQRCHKLPPNLSLAAGPCQLRCQNPAKNADKEYQIAIFYDQSSAWYTVFAAWGRWGNTLDGQVKGLVRTAAEAASTANGLVRTKAKKGYQETATSPQGGEDGVPGA